MGDSLVDSVVSDNIPIFTEEEKFNEAVSSIVKRVEAKLTGGLSCAFPASRKAFPGVIALAKSSLHPSLILDGPSVHLTGSPVQYSHGYEQALECRSALAEARP